MSTIPVFRQFAEYHAKREDNLIEVCDDYEMDEDEDDDTEFYFDEIIDRFSVNSEVLLEDSSDPNLENSSIGTPNLEEHAESSEWFDYDNLNQSDYEDNFEVPKTIGSQSCHLCLRHMSKFNEQWI